MKIADFGLAKLLNEDDDSVELTSPGYGTYWYLPPECFDDGSGRATINSKVDVWSAGVIFFQLLYAKRPFGHELTAKKILMERTILNATRVEFPSKPVVSEETKVGVLDAALYFLPTASFVQDFIRRCLSHRVEDRPEIITIFEDFSDFFRVGFEAAKNSRT